MTEPKEKSMQAAQLTVPTPAPAKRGKVQMVQAELDAPVVAAFKAECRRQGVTQKDVIEWLVAGWLTEKNPAEARKLKLAR